DSPRTVPAPRAAGPPPRPVVRRAHGGDRSRRGRRHVGGGPDLGRSADRACQPRRHRPRVRRVGARGHPVLRRRARPGRGLDDRGLGAECRGVPRPAGLPDPGGRAVHRAARDAHRADRAPALGRRRRSHRAVGRPRDGGGRPTLPEQLRLDLHHARRAGGRGDRLPRPA
ncbi:MAG: Secreted protein, partial [uncultured Gemmatimonadaceae bacterium]